MPSKSCSEEDTCDDYDALFSKYIQSRTISPVAEEHRADSSTTSRDSPQLVVLPGDDPVQRKKTRIRLHVRPRLSVVGESVQQKEGINFRSIAKGKSRNYQTRISEGHSVAKAGTKSKTRLHVKPLGNGLPSHQSTSTLNRNKTKARQSLRTCDSFYLLSVELCNHGPALGVCWTWQRCRACVLRFYIRRTFCILKLSICTARDLRPSAFRYIWRSFAFMDIAWTFPLLFHIVVNSLTCP